MATRVHPIFMTLNGGEMSPKLEGRIDNARFLSGVNLMQNCMGLPQGGAESRGGFHFVAETKTSSRLSRLIPFRFGETQNYILEFGHQYIRFYMNSGQIYTPDSFTVLLLHCDGVDASTTFTDSGVTGHTVTATGNAKVNRTSKFGSGSALFDGTGDYLSIPDHADWYMATGAVTVDFWVRFSTLPSSPDPAWLFSQYTSATDYVRFWLINDEGTYKLIFRTRKPGAGGEVRVPAEWATPAINTWYHIALIRGWGSVADAWAITVDGAQIGTTTTDTGDWPDNSSAFTIGNDPSGGGNDFSGRIDEFRVSKGVARWTADFSPPTLEYPLGQGGTVYELATTYTESDLALLKFLQDDEDMYLLHPDFAPRILTRTAHTTWTLTEVDFLDGPYETEVTAAISSSAVSGQTTIALKGDGTHYILYDAEVAAFVVDEVLTGGTSAATAIVKVSTDWGNEGVLTIGAITGTLQTNENITGDGAGDATTNGTIGDGYLTYSTEAGGPFVEAETLTGGTSGATGTLRGLQDDGATGKIVVEMTSTTNFSVGETITGGTSAATGVVTVFTRAHGVLFNTDDAGIVFGYYEATTPGWTWMEIKSVTNNITAVAIIRGTDIPAGPVDATKYRKGAWSAANGYPKSACFFEGRLLFAGSYEYPQTIWASKVNSLGTATGYTDFTPGTTDDDSYSFTAAQVNIIRWIASAKILALGALDGEASAAGQSDGAITPTAPPLIKPETPHGSTRVDVLQIGKSLLFLQQSGRRLREFVYRYEDDAYTSPDVSRLAEHLFTVSGVEITELAYQQEPHSIIWAVRSDGVLLGCTYERGEDVVGWHQHITDGTFESVASIPYENADQLWVIVNRTIGGATKRFVEYLDPSIDVDSGLTYSGAATTTISGLTHLVGETVEIVGDGAVYPSQVVPASGSLTIDPSASEISAGLGYLPKIITNRPEVQVSGTSQVLKKRWLKVVVRILSTAGLTINGQIVPARIVGDVGSGDVMDSAPVARSEDAAVENLGWDTDGRVTIEQPLPLPMSIVCVMGNLAVGDD